MFSFIKGKKIETFPSDIAIFLLFLLTTSKFQELNFYILIVSFEHEIHNFFYFFNINYYELQ